MFGNTVIRLYICFQIKFMAAEKRKPRSYKIADKPYNKAIKKQKDPPLATFIEQAVTAIGEGGTVTIKPKLKAIKNISQQGNQC